MVMNEFCFRISRLYLLLTYCITYHDYGVNIIPAVICNTFMRPLINNKLCVMWKPRPSVHVSVNQYQPIFMSTLPIAVEQD